jgi:hypothetical protein
VDTVKQSLAALVGSFVLAGCLSSPNVAVLPAADETEEDSEGQNGDSTSSLAPWFDSDPDTPVDAETHLQRGPGTMLARASSVPGDRRQSASDGVACPAAEPQDGLDRAPPNRWQT